jgi:shikimate dehydrogenase
VPTARTHAEVWGSPIAHSLSPTLHRAAYDVLGLDWSYVAREVDSADLRNAWVEHQESLRGLSLTMPLKEDIVGMVESQDEVVTTLGVANTIYVGPDGWALSNTDPWGISGALSEHGIAPQRPLILGAGATAKAVGFALAGMGVSQVDLLVRSAPRAKECVTTLRGLGLEVAVWEKAFTAEAEHDLVVSTLPGGVASDLEIPESAVATAALFDVAYANWPSSLALRWEKSPQQVLSGTWMLVHQAIRQIRFFLLGGGNVALEGEAEVLHAMKKAVGLVPGG